MNFVTFCYYFRRSYKHIITINYSGCVGIYNPQDVFFNWHSYGRGPVPVLLAVPTRARSGLQFANHAGTALRRLQLRTPSILAAECQRWTRILHIPNIYSLFCI